MPTVPTFIASGGSTITATFPVGSRVMVIGAGISSVSDSKGNSYSLDGASGTLSMWSAVVTTQLISGDTISCPGAVTFSHRGFSDCTGDVGAVVTDSGSMAQVNGFPYSTQYSLTIGPADARYSHRVQVIAYYTPVTHAGFNTSNPIGLHQSGVTTFMSCDSATSGGCSGVGLSLLGFVGPTGGNNFPTVSYVGLLVEYGSGDSPECPFWDEEDPDGDTADGADALELQDSALYFSYRSSSNGANVYVTRNAGKTGTTVTVATGLAETAIPTLAADEHDQLFCWYHDSANDAKCYTSEDGGDTWTLFKTVAGPAKWPKGVHDPSMERSWLCYYDTDLEGVRVFRSDDYWQTLTESNNAVPFLDADRRPATLRLDRFGILHLVYKDVSGDILHRYLLEPENDIWSVGTPFTATATDGAAYAVGVERGIGAGWLALPTFPVTYSFRLFLTDEAYQDQFGDSAEFTAASLNPGITVGLLWDGREQIWLAGKLAGTGEFVIYYSDNHGVSWQVPTP